MIAYCQMSQLSASRKQLGPEIPVEYGYAGLLNNGRVKVTWLFKKPPKHMKAPPGAH